MNTSGPSYLWGLALGALKSEDAQGSCMKWHSAIYRVSPPYLWVSHLQNQPTKG